MDSQWSRVWDTLVETPFGLYSTWEQRLGEVCGIPGLHFHVLNTLAQAPEGRLRLQELAEAVRHSQSGTTRLVDRLEKEGLISRLACETDRRVTWALLSEKGKTLYVRALPVWEAFLADHLRKGLTVDEAETLESLLLKLKGTLADGVDTCPPQITA
jgi:DNA-binding MarR family transcriptional regulator